MLISSFPELCGSCSEWSVLRLVFTRYTIQYPSNTHWKYQIMLKKPEGRCCFSQEECGPGDRLQLLERLPPPEESRHCLSHSQPEHIPLSQRKRSDLTSRDWRVTPPHPGPYPRSLHIIILDLKPSQLWAQVGYKGKLSTTFASRTFHHSTYSHHLSPGHNTRGYNKHEMPALHLPCQCRFQ